MRPLPRQVRPACKNSGVGDGSHPGTLARLRWPLAIVAVALVALLAYALTLRSAERAVGKVGQAAQQAGERLAETRGRPVPALERVAPSGKALTRHRASQLGENGLDS